MERGGSRLRGTGGADGSVPLVLGFDSLTGLDERLETLRAPSPEAQRFPTRPAMPRRDVGAVPLDP